MHVYTRTALKKKRGGRSNLNACAHPEYGAKKYRSVI